jgi:cation diffusion facilitator CzcD-associated flavoprotein CzcO
MGDSSNGMTGSGVDGNVDVDVDVVVVGAGFSGLYLLHRLRQLGFSTRVLEDAGDVGGTWYWNRYPGARCDIPTTDYTYSFDPELEAAWTWSEKYATQPEILRYAQFVTDRYDLRRDITFDTRVESAAWDDDAELWRLRTDTGDDIVCRHYIMATGCLSLPKTPDIEGADRFAGDVYFTGRWPHEGVDFTGKRVAVIGTGSSGIQSIPIIAEQASQLTVFQRTPNFSIPAHNGPVRAERKAPLEADRDAYREAAKWSPGGIPHEPHEVMGVTAPEELRRQRFEAAWEAGELFEILGVFADQAVNAASNEIVGDMIRERIRDMVDDPATAEALCPTDHYFGTKRPCLDTNYFATYNQPHVRLVNLRETPITTITETGIDTTEESMEFDAIVYATGFDAMTGAIVSVDITGRDGRTLADKWADGPTTYLGLTTVGFPNFFTITGPGSPSVLSNMMVSIEQHVDWVTDTLAHMREHGFRTIEPTPTAESGWVQHVNDCADITLHPTANSWYIGANVPGKPRVFLPYIGGVDAYRKACDEVVERDYLGFVLDGPERFAVQRRRRPAPAARRGDRARDDGRTRAAGDRDDVGRRRPRVHGRLAAVRPPGPEVAEIVDGTLPGADGDLDYRLYRPEGTGPHPIVVYFHGGGWVLGSHESDDPFCRDLCVRSGAVIISVNYRHAPEARFPAAPTTGSPR